MSTLIRVIKRTLDIIQRQCRQLDIIEKLSATFHVSLKSSGSMTSLPTSSSNNSGTPVGSRSWGVWWRSARFPILVSSILVFVFGSLFYLQTTLVVGTELNSVSWELRSFSFRRDPFTNTQLTGIYYAPSSTNGTWVSAVADAPSLPDAAIRTYLNAKNIGPTRWDLVSMTDGTLSTGRASILVQLIESDQFGSRKYWIDWSNNEPKKAAVLWPAAQQLVSDGSYAQLPDLFELALHEKDDQAFIDAVASFLLAVPKPSNSE